MRKFRIPFIFVIVMLLVSACGAAPAATGGPATEVATEVPVTGSMDVSSDLVIYSGRSEPLIQPVIDAFKAKYPEVNVLLTMEHPAADRPAAWVSPYPKARVAAIILGHDRHSHAHPTFRRLVKNAVLWSVGSAQ